MKVFSTRRFGVRLQQVSTIGLFALAVLACSSGPEPKIATPAPIEKKFVDVDGHRMAYVERGSGRPIVFLHGNPTSSYLWRHILPPLSALGRAIAPDLIGMGDSAKLPPQMKEGRDGRYRYTEHYRHLDAFLEQIGVEREVVLVVHDWGSVLGFEWARRHPDRVAGIVYMEALLRPIRFADLPLSQSMLFRAMRGSLGEWLILDRNFFVESLVPRMILRELNEEERAAYRAPFAQAGEDRRPTLTWPRELPIDGTPADTHAVVEANLAWLKTSPLPKLLIRGEPGMLIGGETLTLARSFPNQSEVTVPGLHYLQEDSPDAIATAISDWVQGLDKSN